MRLCDESRLTSFLPDFFGDVARHRPVQQLPVNFWGGTNKQPRQSENSQCFARDQTSILLETVSYFIFFSAKGFKGATRENFSLKHSKMCFEVKLKIYLLKLPC